jgi:hypothetical protein
MASCKFLTKVDFIMLKACLLGNFSMLLIDRRHKGSLRKRNNLLKGEGRGAESNDRKKAWSSIKHSLFSDYPYKVCHVNKTHSLVRQSL